MDTIPEFWDILFDSQILDIIVDCTNHKIADFCSKLVANRKEKFSYHRETNLNEIRAFIGLLYHSGLWKSNHVCAEKLWDKKNGMTIYRCVMSYKRFCFLSANLRFDYQETRDRNDRFSPIRKIWEIFIENCQQNYKPSKECTVDEQLLSFRGRCIFRMYIKSKPDKYGLKIITLNDAETFYLVNFFIIIYINSAKFFQI